MQRKRVIILGAAGRDFHNFNVFFKNKPEYDVRAFTAAQIPGISKRRYPAQLAGRLYPKGIPIFPEERLPEMIKRLNIDIVCFAYSDVSHEHVMALASIALASGADFWLLGPKSTQLKSKRRVIAVVAVRTGAGKSSVTRALLRALKGKRAVVIRHPMPYGVLCKQKVQRFSTIADIDKAQCTIEEREEYEPLVQMGATVFAGVDYEKILRMAEKEADVIIWDGGNNDFPFVKPDVAIVVADALRAGHEAGWHPGEANFRAADAIVINKIESATKRAVEEIKESAKRINPGAKVVIAKSTISAEGIGRIRGKRVLVVEDGPTVTHGGLVQCAGLVLVKKYNAKLAHPKAVGSLKRVYKEYPHLNSIVPAMGYSQAQLKELAATINKSRADYVLLGTPADLTRLMKINKPVIRARFEVEVPWRKIFGSNTKSF